MHELFQVDLTGVAAGGLEEGAVGGADAYALSGGFAVEEGIAAANANRAW